jgi:fumarate reductase flavoprotein subunit
MLQFGYHMMKDIYWGGNSMSEKKQAKGMSRRGFLKNSALAFAGVVGSGLLVSGCGNGRSKEDRAAIEAAKNAGNSQEPSFLKAPAAIQDSEIKETVEVDIAVVGGGFSGLCAAISAAEEGAKVVLLEKTQNVNFRSYDYGAVNAKVQLEAGTKMDPMQIAQELMRYGAYRADQRVVNQFAFNSGKANDWLVAMELEAGCTIKHLWTKEELVAPSSTLPAYPTLTFVMDPPESALADMPKGLYGGPATYATIYTLLKNAEKHNIKIYYKTPGAQLIRKDNTGRVTGVIGKAEDGKYIRFNTKKGVILCAGDYGHNEEMLKYYIPTAQYVNKISYPGTYNTGDGQQMGLWIGAAIDEGPHTAMYFDKAFVDNAKENPDALVRQPWLSVNMKGERFGNEDLVFGYLVNSSRQQKDHCKWTIWDDKWTEEAPSFHQTACKEMKFHHDPKDVERYIESGLVKKANSLDELADLMSIPKEQFLATVKRYNELAEKGRDEDFGKPSLFMKPLVKAPFYACKMGSSMLVTLGGLQINDKMQVLDTEKEVIPGLYAAGNNSGCFYGNDYPTAIPGNSHGRAYTFGYLAGKNAVKEN